MTGEHDSDLKELMEKILALSPRYGDIMVNGIPGMGMANLDADTDRKLRETAARFARAYRDERAGEGEVRQLADEVEGAVMGTVTVGMTPAGKADEILEDLQRLLTEKYV